MNVDLPSGIEQRLFHLLNADGGWFLDRLAVLLSASGFGVAFFIALAVLIAVVARDRGWMRLEVSLAAAVALSDWVGSQVLRPLFARARPCYLLPPETFRWLAPAADVGSIPSLHSANFFAMATVASAADPRLGAAAFTIAAGVALSRVHVGVHWPMDVLAGAAWGVACGLLVRALAGWFARRRMRHRDDRMSPP
jgi:undecaprenyl-diphosphatase